MAKLRAKNMMNGKTESDGYSELIMAFLFWLNWKPENFVQYYIDWWKWNSDSQWKSKKFDLNDAINAELWNASWRTLFCTKSIRWMTARIASLTDNEIGLIQTWLNSL